MAAIVERWNPHAKVRVDLWGFADLLAVDPGTPGVLAIQATTTEHVSHRLAKFREPPLPERIGLWLDAGNRLSVWGFSKRGARGKRKTWVLTETVVQKGDLV